MSAQPAWDFLSQLKVGTVVAWILLLAGIVSGIVMATIKLYKVFNKYHALREKEEKQSQTISEHEKALIEIRESLAAIRKAQEEQHEVAYKQIRHIIVQICEDALDKGEISINKLRSLEELYDEYVDMFNGNGYVKTLVMRVRKVTIVDRETEEKP